MQTYLVSTTQQNILRLSAGLPHTMFEAYADRFPEAPAVLGEDVVLTYAQIEQQSNRIAHALSASGVQKGDLVAVGLERGPDLVCSILGILKAGAAFAPIDPWAPTESLARILSTAGCAFLLTRGNLASGLPASSTPVLLLDDPAWLDGQPDSRLPLRADREDPACVLFTSGSSGQPKAVLYLQRNLTSRFLNNVEIAALDRTAVFAQASPVTSIDAMDEIFLPLVSGGSVAIFPYETVTDPHRLINSLAARQVTHILLVPSLLRVILSTAEDLQEKLGALKTWIIGGEPLTAALTRDFYEALPQAMLINYYGLTEGDGCYHVTSPHYQYMNLVPIGRPVRNTRVYLLDEHLSPVPAGKAGEICIAGEGLSQGYVNCPEFNAERWTANPFDSDPAYARLFRTGDMGRYRYDGEIEFLGRRDRMVKVRGFRVELGEVEAVLAQHPAVQQCAVTAKHPPEEGQASLAEKTYLVAYVTLEAGQQATEEELREFLRCRLPEFAVPSMVLVLESMPLTPNGKVDILSLPDPEAVFRQSHRKHLAPRDALEQTLARLWEKLLQRHPIGVTDNFFELGGDSLTAIALMLAVEKELNYSLPIVVLFQAPTIARLAEVIRGQGQTALRDCLVPLRTEGTRPPLFCIHADGSVFIYRHFSKYLDPEIPVYGLQAHGLSNPKDEPYTRIDEMAAHYLGEIRHVQPRGPYHFCAFSAGGLIIFEMARQLRAQGETVAFLGMLDAYGPGYPQRLAGKNVAGYKLGVHLDTLRQLGVRGQLNYLWQRTRHRIGLTLSRLLARTFTRLDLPLPGRVRYEYIADLIDQAALAYPKGRTYPGEVTIFRASTQPDGIQPDPSLGWAEMALGNLKIIDVPGTHNSVMMHEPHVAHLVRQINSCLDRLHRLKRP